MIPPFDDVGNLPPGIHRASLDEVKSRFGVGSEIRIAQFESIEWLLDLARRAGVQRIVLNGSFVTDIIEPNDVDCLLLVDSSFPADSAAEAELSDGLPYIDIRISEFDEFDYFTRKVYAISRKLESKGLVEVIL